MLHGAVIDEVVDLALILVPEVFVMQAEVQSFDERTAPIIAEITVNDLLPSHFESVQHPRERSHKSIQPLSTRFLRYRAVYPVDSVIRKRLRQFYRVRPLRNVDAELHPAPDIRVIQERDGRILACGYGSERIGSHYYNLPSRCIL